MYNYIQLQYILDNNTINTTIARIKSNIDK
jgi:hypothetical protein